MIVNIVCYEQLNKGILGKFASKMYENLYNLPDVKCLISNKPLPDADINHHITYYHYQYKIGKINTLMVTHLDTDEKYVLLKRQLKTADVAICMSSETESALLKRGFEREKICYINPAQDGNIKPKKTLLGITTKTYQDKRKKENYLLEICKNISNADFSFFIMGSGWDKIVQETKGWGFEVKYYPNFDSDIYRETLPKLDYYLYWGWDEGSMGYLDALAGGVKTIVTPQGFHLDVPNGITYPVRNCEDIIEILKKISCEKNSVSNSIKSWTWKTYTDKHIKLWEKLLQRGVSDTRPQNSVSNSLEIKVAKTLDRIKRYSR